MTYRRFMIESVDYSAGKADIEQLPAARVFREETADGSPPQSVTMAQRVRPQREFPSAPPRRLDSSPVQIAKLDQPRQGFVLDYAVLNSTANLTIEGDRTYHVSSVAILAGVTTLESAVVKFSAGAEIRMERGCAA